MPHIASKDTVIKYGDMIAGTSCDIKDKDGIYTIEMEGYISEWIEVNSVWVEDSIPFSLYYEDKLQKLE